MKKILASCFALTMTACLALPLAACGGGGKLVSERLPEENFEEAWKAAFSHLSDENIKIECEVKGESSEEGAKDIRYGQTVSRNGDIERWTTSEDTVEDNDGERIVPASDIIIDFSSDPIQGYVCVTDGSFHAFKPKEWTSLAEYMAMEPYEDDSGIATGIRDWGTWDEEMGNLSDFYHYSKKDGGYVHEEDYSEEGENGSVKVIVKFKDRKIVSVLYTVSESDLTYTCITYTWTVTYGGQDVHLPSDEECDFGVRALQSDILPEAGFAEAVEKAFDDIGNDIDNGENFKIEYGAFGYMQNACGIFTRTDKKEHLQTTKFATEFYQSYADGIYEDAYEGYLDFHDGSSTFYIREGDGAFSTRRAEGEFQYISLINRVDFSIYPIRLFLQILDDPQSLRYSEEERGYVWTQPEVGMFEEGQNQCVIKFKDGKIVSFYIVQRAYSSLVENYTTFYFKITYGGQKVELPKVSVEE